MYTVRYFQVSGKCHGYYPALCQDKIKVISDSDKTTIVLCDGAGSSQYGGIAATETSSVIAETFHKDFEEYFYDEIPNIKRRLAHAISSHLISISQEMKIPSNLLASTILAVSSDHHGNFIGLHLGDGHILCNTYGKDELLTISSPQNGYHPGTTFLTMNCPLFNYMRFYRWKDKNIHRLILQTDGMDILSGKCMSNMYSSGSQNILHNLMKSSEAFDDMSYVLFEAENCDIIT